METMNDLISRQAAIDAFEKELTVGESKGNYVTICSAVGYEGAKQILERLPSAQPEPIILCKDCEFYYKGVSFSCCISSDILVEDNDYCSFAEMKDNPKLKLSSLYGKCVTDGEE